MEGFFFATSSGGAVAPDLIRSLEARFNVGGIEGVAAGRGILELKGPAVSESTVDNVCRFCSFAGGILGGAASVNKEFNFHTANYFT